jgi:hypothetical protein
VKPPAAVKAPAPVVEPGDLVADVGATGQPPAVVQGFELEARGGKRTVFYLPPDVIAYLQEIKTAADELEMRISMSSIVTQLVRRYRAERDQQS